MQDWLMVKALEFAEPLIAGALVYWITELLQKRAVPALDVSPAFVKQGVAVAIAVVTTWLWQTFGVDLCGLALQSPPVGCTLESIDAKAGVTWAFAQAIHALRHKRKKEK